METKDIRASYKNDPFYKDTIVKIFDGNNSPTVKELVDILKTMPQDKPVFGFTDGTDTIIIDGVTKTNYDVSIIAHSVLNSLGDNRN